jgi:hypothetical protein
VSAIVGHAGKKIQGYYKLKAEVFCFIFASLHLSFDLFDNIEVSHLMKMECFVDKQWQNKALQLVPKRELYCLKPPD